ncbi:MAG: DUF393 domain-containing protein [Gemmatimonadota bacterium]|nr:DUF393 domain-containing protein [Gemmatimonadota bacterium]
MSRPMSPAAGVRGPDAAALAHPTDWPMLVYDGDCAFCSRSVQFILRHDRRRRSLRFAARDGVAGSAVRSRHPALAHVDSMVWVEPHPEGEVTFIRADAVLAVARYLGGGWALLGALARLVPRFVRDAAYGVVARFRRRLAPGAEVCVVFMLAERARVLD